MVIFSRSQGLQMGEGPLRNRKKVSLLAMGKKPGDKVELSPTALDPQHGDSQGTILVVTIGAEVLASSGGRARMQPRSLHAQGVPTTKGEPGLRVLVPRRRSPALDHELRRERVMSSFLAASLGS